MNYIMIDGKKIELSEETVKNIKEQFMPKENRFVADWEKFKCLSESYSFISENNYISEGVETHHAWDKDLYDVANYFRNEKLAKWVAAKQLLDRKLLKFSMQHEGEKINWNMPSPLKYHIFYSNSSNELRIESDALVEYYGTIYFYSKDIAERALELYKNDILEVRRLKKEYIEDESN